MNQKFQNSEPWSREVSMPLYEGVVFQEISGEYTLPDYHPEVRRVLHVDAQLLPPAKYVSGNRVEPNGGVDYTLLYVGMDGGLYSAPLNAEYSMAFATEPQDALNAHEGVELLCDCVCDTVSTRLTAPRRITIKCRLRAKAAVYGRQILDERIAGPSDPDALQRLEREQGCLGVTCRLSDVITAEATLSLPTPDTRVVSANAAVISGGNRAEGGRILADCTVEGALLCATEGETEGYITVPFRLPVEGEIEHDRPHTDSCRHRVCGQISELNVNASEEGIGLRVGVVLEAQELWEERVRYTEDLYSTDRESVCEYAEHMAPTPLLCVTANLSQNHRWSAAEAGLPEGAEALTAFGKAIAEDMVWEKGKAFVSGRSFYTVIYRKDGEIAAWEQILPFRFELDCPTRAEDFFARVIVGQPSVRIDGDHWMLDAELFLCASLLGRAALRCVCRAELGEPLPPRDDAMIICYPSGGESRWDVAKRYAVPPASVLGDPQTDRYVMIS